MMDIESEFENRLIIHKNKIIKTKMKEYYKHLLDLNIVTNDDIADNLATKDVLILKSSPNILNRFYEIAYKELADKGELD